MKPADLRFISFKTEHLKDTEFPELFRAEACAYHSYLASAQRMQEVIPAELMDLPGTKVFEGKDAYTQMLRLTSGLYDDRKGDVETYSKMREAWKIFKRDNPEVSKELNTTVESIVRDTKSIRAQILKDGLIATSDFLSVTARDMAGMRRGGKEVLLVVAEKQGITEELAKVLGNYTDHMVITHPDEVQLEERYFDIMRLSEKGKFRTKDIHMMHFDEAIARGMSEVSYVFVAYPIGDEEIDRKMVDALKTSDAAVVHIKGDPTRLVEGDPHQRGAIHGAWEELEGLITPQQIKAKRIKDIEHNKLIFADTENACKNCGISFEAGKRPIFREWTSEPKIYAARTGIERTGRSPDPTE